MKNLFIVLAVCALSLSSAFSLEPLNVAIIITNAGPHNLTVEVNDYTGAVANVYTENFNGLTPNSSGVISFTLGVGSAPWTAITAGSVNTHYIIDVKIGATLFAQYRLDELIRLQAQSGVTDKDGNIVPGENDASTLGTDSQRWKDVFVGPASFHIGAPGDEASISYTTGTNTLNLTSDITKTSANLEVTGNATITGNSAVNGNSSIGDSKINDSHTILGKVNLKNEEAGAGNASLKISNDDATNDSYALNITKGHQANSVDNGTTTIGNNDAITVGINTIIRLKSGGGNISNNLISDGTTKGQILYITNEDAGEIDLDDSNIIGAAKIDARSALHLIWVGNKWAVINRY